MREDPSYSLLLQVCFWDTENPYHELLEVNGNKELKMDHTNKTSHIERVIV